MLRSGTVATVTACAGGASGGLLERPSVRTPTRRAADTASTVMTERMKRFLDSVGDPVAQACGPQHVNLGLVEPIAIGVVDIGSGLDEQPDVAGDQRVLEPQSTFAGEPGEPV